MGAIGPARHYKQVGFDLFARSSTSSHKLLVGTGHGEELAADDFGSEQVEAEL